MPRDTKPLPDVEELVRLLRYETETGRLFWRPRTADLFSDGVQTAEHSCARWNASYAGTEAFTTEVNGYLYGSIWCARYAAHRVIWKMLHGTDPEVIDHVDGDKKNNRPGNLRDGSQGDNRRNALMHGRNTSGANGVSWHKPTARWRALGCKAGRQVALGYYHDKEEAIAARRAWEAENGFSDRHGRAA